MKGHIRKRGERSWAVVLDLGRDPSGKRRQKWHSVRGTKKDAERELAKQIHALNTGDYVEPAKLNVGQFLEKWLEDYARSHVSRKTFERYAGIIKHHLVSALGQYAITKLQPLHIQSYYSEALNSGRKDGRTGGLSPQTIVHHHRVLSEALDRAVKWGLLGRNPANAVEPPRPETTEVRALDEAQIVWLLEAALNTRLYIPILLASTTGMRRGEILALRWQDVEPTHGFLSVRRSLEETRSGVAFKSTKNRRSRQISMPALLQEALHAHKEKQLQIKHALGAAYVDDDLVCCRDDGTIWKPSAFTSAYRDLLRRRKISNIRFHDLRHSHASQLLRAGVNPKVISERLGHSKVGFTLDVYAHLLPGMQEDAAERVDAGLRAAFARHHQA